MATEPMIFDDHMLMDLFAPKYSESLYILQEEKSAAISSLARFLIHTITAMQDEIDVYRATNETFADAAVTFFKAHRDEITSDCVLNSPSTGTSIGYMKNAARQLASIPIFRQEFRDVLERTLQLFTKVQEAIGLPDEASAESLSEQILAFSEREHEKNRRSAERAS